MEKVSMAMHNKEIKIITFENKHMSLVLELYKEKESLIHIAPFKDKPDSFFELFLTKALKRDSIYLIYSLHNVFIGIVTLNLMDAFFHIGIHLKLEHQKKGYGKKALIKMIDYSKNKKALNEVYALIEHMNVNSIHLFKKMGFEYTETINIANTDVQKYKLNLR